MNLRSTVPGLPSTHRGAHAPGEESAPHSHFVAATVMVLRAFSSLCGESGIHTITLTAVLKNPRRWQYYHLHFMTERMAGLHTDHPCQRQDPKPEFLPLQPLSLEGFLSCPLRRAHWTKNVFLNSRAQVHFQVAGADRVPRNQGSAAPRSACPSVAVCPRAAAVWGRWFLKGYLTTGRCTRWKSFSLLFF